MGQLATDIHDAAGIIPNAAVADPADLLTGPQLLKIFAAVEAAVAVLELLSRGARIVRVAGRPDDVADGENGDLGLNTLTADYYGKDVGAWTFLYNGKGPRGTDATGKTGASAYEVAVEEGFQGSVTQWLASLGKPGADGRSAYKVATDAGFQGSVTQWLASLKGDQGNPGQDGGDVFHESFAPVASYRGKPGDTYYWHISRGEYAIYDYPSALVAVGANPWRQRFITPEVVVGPGPTNPGPAGVSSFNTRTGAVTMTVQDVADVLRATATVTFTVVNGKLELAAVGNGNGGTGTVKSVNGNLPDAAGNVIVSVGGASYTDEQAQDAAAALLAAGTHAGITFTYDDAGNKLSATVAAAISRLYFTYEANATATGRAEVLFFDQPGAYEQETATGLSNISYRKNGTLTALPVLLVLGDVLEATATTATPRGTLVLRKQA